MNDRLEEISKLVKANRLVTERDFREYIGLLREAKSITDRELEDYYKMNNQLREVKVLRRGMRAFFIILVACIIWGWNIYLFIQWIR